LAFSCGARSAFKRRAGKSYLRSMLSRRQLQGFVMRHQRGKRQNGEVSSSSENNASASSTVRLLHSGSRRSGLYQGCAKRLHLLRGIISPRGRFQSLHHFSTCSSDQKSSIVFQLKTMSSHQCAAGMAKWAIPRTSSSEPFVIFRFIAVLQQPQEASMAASCFNIAGMPIASQMQLA
jgi:hypothetical protein